MANCPNKNLRAWGDLEIAQPNRAFELWDKYEGIVPNKYYQVKSLIDTIKKELQFRSNVSNLALNMLKKRMDKYNETNGVSHRLGDIKQVGESNNYKFKLVLNYQPTNPEAKAERLAIRSEEGKTFSNIPETRFKPSEETFDKDIRYYKGDRQLMEQEALNDIIEGVNEKVSDIVIKLFPEITVKYTPLKGVAGQTNLKALEVLLDPNKQQIDTLPHEFLHNYISWFEDTPLVKEAIAKYGSEEALVQAIGEQVVVQKGEAYNWWKKFTNWVQTLFDNISTASKEDLRNIITDAFLTRTSLVTQETITTPEIEAMLKEGIRYQQEQAKDNDAVEESLSKDQEALETVLKSLTNKINSLKHRGKGKGKFATSQQKLLDELITNYEEKHYMLGINHYLKNSSFYYKELYGSNKDGTLGRLGEIKKKAKDMTYEEARILGSTIKDMGNFATSQINVLSQVITA